MPVTESLADADADAICTPTLGMSFSIWFGAAHMTHVSIPSRSHSRDELTPPSCL
jgi:hypothetical protein